MNLILIFIFFSLTKFKFTNTYMKQCLVFSALVTSASTHLSLFQDSDSEENDVLEQETACGDKKPETKEDEYVRLRRFHNQCVLQTGVAPALIKQLMHGNWVQTDVNLRKWCLCVLNKVGIMSAEGVLKMDVVWTKIPDKDKASAEKLIDSCLDKTPTAVPPYDVAWHYLKCHHKTDTQGDFSSLGIL